MHFKRVISERDKYQTLAMLKCNVDLINLNTRSSELSKTSVNSVRYNAAKVDKIVKTITIDSSHIKWIAIQE